MNKLPLDYCRCRGLNCPVRDNCLRYTDWPPRERLSLMATGDWQDGVCLHLIPDQPNSKFRDAGGQSPALRTDDQPHSL